MARVNGLRNLAGTVYGDNAKCFLITVKTTEATAVVDLRAEDDAIDEAVEQIVKVINPLAYFVTNSTAGTIMGIFDVSASAGDIQHRIRYIGVTATLTEVTAGSFVVGNKYTISVPGNTDFTLIGAGNSSVGTKFTATGVGVGTGKATAFYPVTNIGPNDIDVSGTTVTAATAISFT